MIYFFLIIFQILNAKVSPNVELKMHYQILDLTVVNFSLYFFQDKLMYLLTYSFQYRNL